MNKQANTCNDAVFVEDERLLMMPLKIKTTQILKQKNVCQMFLNQSMNGHF